MLIYMLKNQDVRITLMNILLTSLFQLFCTPQFPRPGAADKARVVDIMFSSDDLADLKNLCRVLKARDVKTK